MSSVSKEKKNFAGFRLRRCVAHRLESGWRSLETVGDVWLTYGKGAAKCRLSMVAVADNLAGNVRRDQAMKMKQVNEG